MTLQLGLLLSAIFIAAADVHPPCRKSPEFHSLAWSSGQKLVAFGGKGKGWVHKKHKKHKMKAESEFLGDTWSFDLDTGRWTELDSAEHPSARWKPASTSIYNDSTFLLFGGCEGDDANFVSNDIWMLQQAQSGGGSWTQLYTKNTPRARRGHVVVATSTHLFVMGGKSWSEAKGVEVLTDVWSIPVSALNGGEGQWVRGADFPNIARWGATGTLIRGPKGEEVVAYFGGRNYNHDPNLPKYLYHSNLWFYDVVANTWTQADLDGQESPEARDHHAATAINGDLFIFGGRVKPTKTADAVLNDVWTFSLSTGKWKHLESQSTSAPKPRFMPGLANVKWRGQEALAVFAGETLPGSTKKSSFNDVWVFAPSDGRWSWMELYASDCSYSPPEFEVLGFLEQGSPVQLGNVLAGICVLAIFAIVSGAVFKHASEDSSDDYLKM